MLSLRRYRLKETDRLFAAIAIALLEHSNERLVCVDVGSAGGINDRFTSILPQADIIGFEADPDECEHLNLTETYGVRHINAAIGRANERVTLELHNKRQTSSLYRADMSRLQHFHDWQRFAKQGEIQFTTRSLDMVCASEGLNRIDCIKVDSEGHELAIVEGYSGTILAAELEVQFHPILGDVSLFDDVMSHMRKRGFLLVDLRRNYSNPTRAIDTGTVGDKGFIIQGDSLFVLDPFLEQTHSVLQTPSDRARYMAILCLYGYPAMALMVTDVFQDIKLISTEEADSYRQLIMGFFRKNRLKVKLNILRLLYIVEKLVRLPVAMRGGLHVDDFACGDGPLGNWDRPI